MRHRARQQPGRRPRRWTLAVLPSLTLRDGSELQPRLAHASITSPHLTAPSPSPCPCLSLVSCRLALRPQALTLHHPARPPPASPLFLRRRLKERSPALRKPRGSDHAGNSNKESHRSFEKGARRFVLATTEISETG